MKLSVSSDAPGQKMFMLGNEAIARGAIEAGVQVAAAYPGTPSTEILETLSSVAKDFGIYTEWSVNEKLAFEVAFAASLCGVRAMASMKHVGVNVAHDPLMTASYIGARGGMVLVSADDPWAWSSQNEQDNRYIAEQGYLPVLEPSSVQEAKDMMADAFRLSEEFKQPFILRTVTRINHGRSDVLLGEISRDRRKGFFEKEPSRLVLTPAEARKDRPLMLERFDKIKKAVDSFPYNSLELADGARLGIIACGLSYSYTLEALKWLGLDGKVSVLKIGTPHPLPEELVKKLLGSVAVVLVVEELEPFVEHHVKAIAAESGIDVKFHGKDLIPLIGELSTEKVTRAIAKLTNTTPPVDFAEMERIRQETAPLLPLRPPTLCAGCPHRATQYAMKIAGKRVAKQLGKGEPVYTGDIGCYTLSYLPPIESMDLVLCMGAGFGTANGLAHVLDVPVIAQVGDSTFFHAGIPAMINAVYNKAKITMVVLDNSATAMTGFQPHPGTGRTASGDVAAQLKIEDIARACGVKFVEVIDPFDMEESIKIFEKAMRFDGPSVVVSRRPCAMLVQRDARKRGEELILYRVERERCDPKCSACFKLLGCPAIVRENGLTVIDSSLCTGCSLCAQVCHHKAIVEVAR
ncbi:MAG: indolepyruvate ferredoxin oxidoreductase subunit alpha [Chloroflexi bacterium]|nr:indolepyruvate ferredoxin oxidoreductase subunit alpha [Chloroflexota bacterium]